MIETLPGKGCFLKENHSPLRKEVRRKLLTEEVDQAIVKAHHFQVPRGEFIELVNERDYTLIQEFLRRRSELGSEARTRLGAQLAEGLQARMGLQPIGDPERFLQDVAGNYQLLRRSQQLEG